jgi:radical SAM superfamily enzyme YgiQ (UPF0313 family)
MLKHNGFGDVKGIDLFWDKLEDYTEDIIKADYIGVHVTSKLFDNSILLAKKIKDINLNAKIVFGGAHPTLYPKECLDMDCVDFVIRGEGEFPFLSLVRGDEQKTIEGLCYKFLNVNIIKESFFVKDLDILPFPDRDLFDMKRYATYIFYPVFVPIMSSRSCPYDCNNCQPALRMICGSYRYRSPQNVIDEFIHLRDNYNVKRIWFNDNDVTANQKWLKEFCELMIANKIKLKWGCNGRGNTLNEENMKLMKKAGCISLQFGLEFCNQRVLTECLNKRTDFENTKKVIEIANKLKLRLNAYYMFGVPGSTKEEEYTSIDTASKLGINSISFKTFQPYPLINMNVIAEKKGWLMAYEFAELDEDHCFYNTDNWNPSFVEKDLVEYIKDKFKDGWIHDSSSEDGSSVSLIFRNIKTDMKNSFIVFFGRQILSFLKDFKFRHIKNIWKGVCCIWK